MINNSNNLNQPGSTSPESTSPVLAVELSNPSASSSAHCVAIFSSSDQGAQLVSSLEMPQGIRSSDGIMASIEKLCKDVGVVPSDIGRILVSIGPGGYTALRISTTTAKVLACALDCELVGIPSASVAARSISESHRPALIGLASKNTHIHATLLNEDGSLCTLGMRDVDVLDDFKVRSIHADGHLPDPFKQRADELKIELLPIVLDARMMLSASEGVGPVEPSVIEPLYAREPDAVTQWRARKPK